ncbi:MAG: Membrane-bound lytic murein transglycosylase [Bacteroidetes bacterium]|nr:Membrane-bound lytic murein transglycosylase [Bacteroidota bacterium]
MRSLILKTIVAGVLILWSGCASQEPSQQPESSDPQTAGEVLEAFVQDPRATPEAEPGLVGAEEVMDDSLVQYTLETARLHYISALTAEQNGDTVRSAVQFESAIDLLDRLSTVPGIEDNRDFNDLSRAVVQDYETYIAAIDSLNPESSIFALREKMNQVIDVDDSTLTSQPTTVLRGTTVPLVINELVERNILFFQTKGREHMERWLHRAGMYFPMMRPIFQEEGVPEELMFLAMAESGLNPNARSWARAVGMWQFMKGTGRLYGLRTGFWMDERRDFEKATRAAARHLNDLYQEFDDWYLAIAAYNSGAGRIYRGIRRSRSTDFWTMRRHLPRETRNYVPQYIAVTVIGLNPEAYGFSGVTPAAPLQYEYVTVDDCVDLSTLADCAVTDVWTLKDLNPELVQFSTPPGVRSYRLRVPPGRSTVFAEKYAAIPESEKRDWIVHQVRKGETLSKIGSRYGIPTTVIAEANHLKSNRLSVRQTLVIPVPKASDRYKPLIAQSSTYDYDRPTKRKSPNRSRVDRELRKGQASQQSVPKDRVSVSYKVRKGDTLGHIAEMYACRAADIRNWNDISYGEHIRAGQTLTVWVRASQKEKYAAVDRMSDTDREELASSSRQKTASSVDESADKYEVRPGDTLERIAQAHQVSVQQLKLWNNLKGSKIYAGQELNLMADARRVKIVTEIPKDAGKASRSGGQTIYVVKKGDTLWDIARAYAVTAKQLQAWNDLNGKRIYAGQELVIHTNGGTR